MKLETLFQITCGLSFADNLGHLYSRRERREPQTATIGTCTAHTPRIVGLNEEEEVIETMIQEKEEKERRRNNCQTCLYFLLDREIPRSQSFHLGRDRIARGNASAPLPPPSCRAETLRLPWPQSHDRPTPPEERQNSLLRSLSSLSLYLLVCPCVSLRVCVFVSLSLICVSRSLPAGQTCY